jgi:general secretion pathway protein E
MGGGHDVADRVGGADQIAERVVAIGGGVVQGVLDRDHVALAVLGGGARLRKLCPHCSREHDGAAHWAKELARNLRSIKALGAPDIRQARGCSQCNETGFSGRSTIAEILLVTAELQRLVLSSASDGQIESTARDAGMATMYENGSAKVWRGETTIEEVLRATRMG